MSKISWKAEWSPAGAHRVSLRSCGSNEKTYMAVRIEQANLLEVAAWCGLEVRITKGWVHSLETTDTPKTKIFVGWWIVQDCDTKTFYAYDNEKFKRVFKKAGA